MSKSYKIAIHPDKIKLRSGRHQSFSDRCIEVLKETNHQVHLVNASDPNFFQELNDCDGFMWWFAHIPFPRRLGKRLVQAIEHGCRIPTFPNWKTIWHFDDKIAEIYLLQAAGIPSPKTWVLWKRDEAINFCKTAQYPLVFKLTTGITSENVKLLRNFSEANYWIDLLFGPGVFSLERPELSPRLLIQRLRNSARLMLSGLTPNPGHRYDLQKNYFFVQEFLAGNDYDTRITVIGNRAFGFRRNNRPNDFRASGSGRIENDPAKISLEDVRLAFRVARTLETQSVAVDVLRRDGEPTINEISYYYEGWLVEACPGHWELRGDLEKGKLEWVEGHLRPEDAILEDFLALLDSRNGIGIPMETPAKLQ